MVKVPDLHHRRRRRQRQKRARRQHPLPQEASNIDILLYIKMFLCQARLHGDGPGPHTLELAYPSGASRQADMA